MNTGICALAPESNPITVNVAYKVLVVLNNVGTDVPFPLQVNPITVWEVAVPFVIIVAAFVEAWATAAALLIPLPTKAPNTLISDTVNWYPDGSVVWPSK